MRFKDESAKEEIAELNAESWMLECLDMNPEYCWWGPFVAKGHWKSPVLYEDWISFGPWDLDNLNEIVNFYFEVIKEWSDPEAKLRLVLWILHPARDCSRSVEIDKIEKDELPFVIEHLKNAAERNAERFSKLTLGVEGDNA